MITEDQFNNMPDGEKMTFFLQNVLRLLKTDQQAILARSILERLPEPTYQTTVYEAAILKGSPKLPTDVEIIKFANQRGQEQYQNHIVANDILEGLHNIAFREGAKWMRAKIIDLKIYE